MSLSQNITEVSKDKEMIFKNVIKTHNLKNDTILGIIAQKFKDER